MDAFGAWHSRDARIALVIMGPVLDEAHVLVVRARLAATPGGSARLGARLPSARSRVSSRSLLPSFDSTVQ